ncbi:hypothetical protein CR513_08431, partial [Mucuna pruriens]
MPLEGLTVENNGLQRILAENSTASHPTRKRKQMEKVGYFRPQMKKTWSRRKLRVTPFHYGTIGALSFN